MHGNSAQSWQKLVTFQEAFMDVAHIPGFAAHERVQFFADEGLGLAGVIAIHSTAMGPAMGGCRAAAYIDDAAALTDALRLSQGMSFKNAMADLPAGGGKAVLYRLPQDPALRTEAFAAFGRAVDAMCGDYVTAEDVGTSVADMQAVARSTSYVAGLPTKDGQAGGDPSPWTALGIFEAMKVAAGRPLQGARVAVQGLGSVGYRLCEHLHAAGAKLVVSDVNPERVLRAKSALGAEAASVERIHRVAADVFSPNALGAILDIHTIPELQAPVVCGGANNQLATAADGLRLAARGVVYAPDYIVNAGGIINVVAEFFGEPQAKVEVRVGAIAARLERILIQAKAEGRPTHELADEAARAKIERAEIEAAA
jgi:leucine dehydrogenase